MGTTTSGARTYSSVAAFFSYLILSFLFFGRGLVGHLSDRYIGIGTDPGLFIFFLEWWKYVFAHHVNPFFTYMQWAPSGANLAWSTFIPLFGICAIPLTATLGPIATFNLLVLICPALAAWTAFLLCRYLCSSFWPALVGGYAFGFSPWMLAHLLGHLTVLMIFPVPLMVLVTLRMLNEEISASRFTVTLTILIVTLFLCWPEAVATSTLFGGIAIVLAWWSGPQWRGRLQALILPGSIAYLASAIILSPYLYYFFAFGQPAFPGGMRPLVSVHPLTFIIPPPVTAVGLLPHFRELSGGSHIYETGAYIALPMLLIIAGYMRTHWDDWRARLLVSILLVVCIASLGSSLTVGGHASIPLPWAIATHLPLMDKALPARFSIYSFLVIGVILSLWLNVCTRKKTFPIVAACGVVLLTLPNPSTAFWTTAVTTPAFFSTGEFKRYIAPGENVLILPYGEISNSNIWQASTGLYFRMAGGYLGQPPVPSEYLPYFPIVYDLYNLADSPFSEELLKVFLVQKEIKDIVVADEGPQVWRNSFKPGPWCPEATNLNSSERALIRSLLASLGVNPVHVGGISFYNVPLDKLNAYRNIDPRELERRSVTIQLGILINAANDYLSTSHSPPSLNPLRAQRLGLLPPYWVSGLGIFDPYGPLQNGLVLMSLKNGDVLLGVIGARETLEHLESIYRPYAKAVEVSPLKAIAAWAESSRWILLLEYNPARLPSAAAFARQRDSAERRSIIPTGNRLSDEPLGN